MEAHPPPVQMIQMLSGLQVSQALYVAAKLGVPDLLVDGPWPVDALASDLDVIQSPCHGCCGRWRHSGCSLSPPRAHTTSLRSAPRW